MLRHIHTGSQSMDHSVCTQTYCFYEFFVRVGFFVRARACVSAHSYVVALVVSIRRRETRCGNERPTTTTAVRGGIGGGPLFAAVSSWLVSRRFSRSTALGYGVDRFSSQSNETGVVLPSLVNFYRILYIISPTEGFNDISASVYRPCRRRASLVIGVTHSFTIHAETRLLIHFYNYTA